MSHFYQLHRLQSCKRVRKSATYIQWLKWMNAQSLATVCTLSRDRCKHNRLSRNIR